MHRAEYGKRFLQRVRNASLHHPQWPSAIPTVAQCHTHSGPVPYGGKRFLQRVRNGSLHHGGKRFASPWYGGKSTVQGCVHSEQCKHLTSSVATHTNHNVQRATRVVHCTPRNAQRAPKYLMRMPCMFLMSSVSTSWTSACWSVWQIHHQHHSLPPVRMGYSPEYSHDLTCANTGRARVKPRTAAPGCSQRFIGMSEARPSAKVWHELNAQMWRVPAETPDL